MIRNTLRAFSAFLALALLLATVPTAQSQTTFRAQTETERICAAENFARSEGRAVARIPREQMAALQNWCRQSAARDVPAAGRTGPMTLAAPGGGQGLWCPPFSTKCYCWNGPHWKGCDNFAAHCTDGLTCGPLGKSCHCTSK